MWCQRPHLAADTEIGEDFVAQQTIGVLVVGGIGSAGNDNEQDGEDVEDLCCDAVAFLLAEAKGQEHHEKVRKEEGGDGG